MRDGDTRTRGVRPGARNTAGTTAPQWYKDAVFYELHVRAFADSNGDGAGDFKGLVGKLDYLRDLGVTAIWLLPFFPSPLRDDGYDISDYTAVHPAYGTLDDFRDFLDEAHRLDLRVLIELVLNHTSDQHPWFQRARGAPEGSPERDFYVWSDSPERYGAARVIFQDSEQSNWSWDPVAGAYYWHRFYAHQPDLNYQHRPVREAMLNAVDFWLEMGVDGLRLDAVPYLVEKDNTTSENLPGTHQFLKALRKHVDAKYVNRVLLAEANQWPEDAVAYFGDGDECHMAFHFPLMPRLFMALRTEDRLPVTDILEQTPPIPEHCQWALFLRNHDELTLEMVTDEERLYMYHAFAPAEQARINLGIRRRLAPLLGNSRRRIELMNALLCSLPGTPVIYYGDEIGMGDNIYLGDRDSVRTPMQWSADRNAGFSMGPTQRLYLPLVVDHEYHHQAVHVEAQAENPHSLLSFMKRLLEVRRRSQAFGRGSLHMLDPTNHRVLAFVREYDEERVLIVANLCRFSQAVELDLKRWKGQTPVEAFGRIPFWEIDDRPYSLTLGPHGFYWFLLTDSGVIAPRLGTTDAGASLAVIRTADDWAGAIAGNDRARLEEVLPGVLSQQPWFRGSPDTVLNARVIDAVALPQAAPPTWVVPIRIAYSDRDPEYYLLALSCFESDGSSGPVASGVTRIARLRSDTGGEVVLVDGISQELIDGALRWLAEESGAPLHGAVGQIVLEHARPDERLELPSAGEPLVASTEEHRINPVFQLDRVAVKFLRRINEGINPEWEIGRALTEVGYANAPEVLGALEYRRPQKAPMTIGVLQEHVVHDADGWDFTMRFLDALIHRSDHAGIVVAHPAPSNAQEIMAVIGQTPPEPLDDLLEPWLRFVRLLGRRTAELHHALASAPGRPELAPAPYTAYDRRSIYQSMRGLAARALRSLNQSLPPLGHEEQQLIDAVTERENDLDARFRRMLDVQAPGWRIRGHGDLHLGQVLLAGDDIVFVDFEGEPDRFLEERRLKTSPLRDVAGMLHSIQVAALHAWRRQREDANRSAETAQSVQALLETCSRHGSAAYTGEYLDAAEADALLPVSVEDRIAMLDALLLERAVYEVWQAAQHRPDHLQLPLERLRQVLDAT
jgi:maltose alpha-D-glucosyltransferase/alpha-amylase